MICEMNIIDDSVRLPEILLSRSALVKKIDDSEHFLSFSIGRLKNSFVVDLADFNKDTGKIETKVITLNIDWLTIFRSPRPIFDIVLDTLYKYLECWPI